MVDIKQAIQAAKAFAKDVLNQADFLLEEVASDDDAFEITLSLPRRTGTPQAVYPFQRLENREFKTFRVLKKDGTVDKMSIREIA